MQNAIFTISHFQVSGSLDIKKEKKTTSVCWLFVCCLFLLIPPPLWKQPLPHPLTCLPHVFGHSSIHTRSRTHTDTSRWTVCEARRAVSWAADWHNAHAQAFLQSPVTCMLRHTPRLQAEAHVRHPVANCLLPALSYTLSTLLQASSPRRLWNRPGTKCATIRFVWTWAVAHLLLSENQAGCYKEVRYHLFPETLRFTVTLLRNAIIHSFNTNLNFWSETHISAKLHRD